MRESPMDISCPYCHSPIRDVSLAVPLVVCPQCGREVNLEDEAPTLAQPTFKEREGQQPTQKVEEPFSKTVAFSKKRLGGYELLELLGQGGMAAVYKARQLSLDRIVAVKVLPKNLASNPEFIKRFNREAKTLAKLEHPHIVQIIDRGVEGDVYYFAMEYVDGTSLDKLLEEKRLSLEEKLRILIDVCKGLEYAHRRGVVHRDIKPANILIRSDGVVKVSDFGIAAILGRESPEDNLTATGVGMGTLRYMAPEQRFDAKNVDHRADLYSLGVMMYEMFTGQVPVGRFPSLKEVVPGIDPRLDEVVNRCLELRRENRPQSAQEVRQILEDILLEKELPKKKSKVSVKSLPEKRTASPKLVKLLFGILLIGSVTFLGVLALRKGLLPSKLQVALGEGQKNKQREKPKQKQEKKPSERAGGKAESSQEAEPGKKKPKNNKEKSLDRGSEPAKESESGKENSREKEAQKKPNPLSASKEEKKMSTEVQETSSKPESSSQVRKNSSSSPSPSMSLPKRPPKKVSSPQPNTEVPGVSLPKRPPKPSSSPLPKVPEKEDSPAKVPKVERAPSPKQLLSLLQKARKYCRAGNLEEAKKVLEKVPSRFWPPAFFDLLENLEKLKVFQKALEDFVVKDLPSFERFRSQYEKMEKMSLFPLPWRRQVSEIERQMEAFLEEKIQSYIQRKQWQKGEKLLEKWRSLFPKSSRWKRVEKQFTQAKELWKKALQKKIEEERRRKARLAMLKEWEKAEEKAERENYEEALKIWQKIKALALSFQPPLALPKAWEERKKRWEGKVQLVKLWQKAEQYAQRGRYPQAFQVLREMEKLSNSFQPALSLKPRWKKKWEIWKKKTQYLSLKSEFKTLLSGPPLERLKIQRLLSLGVKLESQLGGLDFFQKEKKKFERLKELQSALYAKLSSFPSLSSFPLSRSFWSQVEQVDQLWKEARSIWPGLRKARFEKKWKERKKYFWKLYAFRLIPFGRDKLITLYPVQEYQYVYGLSLMVEKGFPVGRAYLPFSWRDWRSRRSSSAYMKGVTVVAAEAVAQVLGMRLPTEEEWKRAKSFLKALGQWEFTRDKMDTQVVILCLRGGRVLREEISISRRQYFQRPIYFRFVMERRRDLESLEVPVWMRGNSQ